MCCEEENEKFQQLHMSYKHFIILRIHLYRDPNLHMCSTVLSQLIISTPET